MNSQLYTISMEFGISLLFYVAMVNIVLDSVCRELKNKKIEILIYILYSAVGILVGIRHNLEPIITVFGSFFPLCKLFENAVSKLGKRSWILYIFLWIALNIYWIIRVIAYGVVSAERLNLTFGIGVLIILEGLLITYFRNRKIQEYVKKKKALIGMSAIVIPIILGVFLYPKHIIGFGIAGCMGMMTVAFLQYKYDKILFKKCIKTNAVMIVLLALFPIIGSRPGLIYRTDFVAVVDNLVIYEEDYIDLNAYKERKIDRIHNKLSKEDYNKLIKGIEIIPSTYLEHYDATVEEPRGIEKIEAVNEYKDVTPEDKCFIWYKKASMIVPYEYMEKDRKEFLELINSLSYKSDGENK